MSCPVFVPYCFMDWPQPEVVEIEPNNGGEDDDI